MIGQKVEEIFGEIDPERRKALARRLRAEIGGALGEKIRAELEARGIDIEKLTRVLRDAGE